MLRKSKVTRWVWKEAQEHLIMYTLICFHLRTSSSLYRGNTLINFNTCWFSIWQSSLHWPRYQSGGFCNRFHKIEWYRLCQSCFHVLARFSSCEYYLGPYTEKQHNLLSVSQICHFYSDFGAHIIVGNPLACKHTCNLHLHSTPEYQPVVSPGFAYMKTPNVFWDHLKATMHLKIRPVLY